MLNFFKKKPKQPFSDFSHFHTDIHSHILPGIDDGAKDLEDALNLVEGMMNLGFKRLIATPHVYWQYYPNTSETIKKAGEELKRAVRVKEWDVQIDYAAEYFLDEHFEKILSEDDILTLPGNYLLFELPFVAAPPQMESVIFNMNIKRYKPILAHPERYLYWGKDFKKYERIKDMGCLMQLNLLSLAGGYGPEVAQNAKKMLKAGLFDLVGTDGHHLGHVGRLKEALNKKLFSALEEHTFSNQMLFNN